MDIAKAPKTAKPKQTTYQTTKKNNKMKNFLSQTWVVATLAIIILAIVAYLAFNLSDKKKSGDYTYAKK